jgi:drug/metabolite transporter (DMT)-like permease
MLSRASILFSLCFGLFWLKEHLTRVQLLGAFVAIAGVFTIAYQPADYLRLGSVMILCSTFMYALHAAIIKRWGEQMGFIDFFFFRLLCTTSIMFLSALGRQSLVFPEGKVWLLLLLVGTADVAVSRSLYYLALRRLKMSIHAIVLALSPVAAIGWALLLFDTFPNAQQLIGGAAVIAGVLLVVLVKAR